MKKYDIAAIGEMLIDFIPCGISDSGKTVLEPKEGGAPCNVLAMAAKLSKKTAFIGKVGADAFGEMLTDTASRAGIYTGGVVKDENVFTTLAFVSLNEEGDRSFSFARKPGADTCLNKDEISCEIIQNTKIFHFGTLSMTDEPAKSATKEAVAIAKKCGALISFDPNIRPLLWKNIDDAKKAMEWGFENADILKISDDEIALATGEEDITKALGILSGKYENLSLIFVTLGRDGSVYKFGSYQGRCASPKVKTIDTTGAGDTFMGACLSFVSDRGLDFSCEELDNAVRFASCAAAIVTTKKGAIESMPEKDEVIALLNEWK